MVGLLLFSLGQMAKNIILLFNYLNWYVTVCEKLFSQKNTSMISTPLQHFLQLIDLLLCRREYTTRPSKQCKSLVDFLILRQYLKIEFFVNDMKNEGRNFFVERKKKRRKYLEKKIFFLCMRIKTEMEKEEGNIFLWRRS